MYVFTCKYKPNIFHFKKFFLSNLLFRVIFLKQKKKKTLEKKQPKTITLFADIIKSKLKTKFHSIIQIFSHWE